MLGMIENHNDIIKMQDAFCRTITFTAFSFMGRVRPKYKKK